MRKINENLINRLLHGDLVPLLEYVKADNELRLEVRPKGEAFIYYRKGKVLEIGSLKVDKKYGNVPSTNLAISNPPLYFTQIKNIVDKWLEKNKKRAEFDTEQNIAQWNQDTDDKYLIIDMEYAFERYKIDKREREKRAIFDLLGIERETNKVVLFEVKRGMGATTGNAGINEHIEDFNNICADGRNSSIYRNNLFQDVKNIVSDKIKLGLISNFDVPKGLSKHNPEFIFVFHPEFEYEIDAFKRALRERTKLIVVSENDYKLR